MSFFHKTQKVSLELEDQIKTFRQIEAATPVSKGNKIVKFRKSKNADGLITIMTIIAQDTMSNIVKDALVQAFIRVTGHRAIIQCPHCRSDMIISLKGLDQGNPKIYYVCTKNGHEQLVPLLTTELVQNYRLSKNK